MTTTYTYSSTFTRTHAKYLASKIAADLFQMQLFYGEPSDTRIDDYLDEVVILLLGGCLDSVDYGFRRDGELIVALNYVVQSDGTIVDDDHSGRVPPGVDITGASWYSHLRKNSAFWSLSLAEQRRIEESLPIYRTSGEEPQTGNGIWVTDKSYSSNGVGIQRQTFRPF